MLDGHLGSEYLLVAPRRLEVPVTEIGLEEVPLARALGDLEDPFNGAVLLGDVELLDVELRHLSLLLEDRGIRQPADRARQRILISRGARVRDPAAFLRHAVLHTRSLRSSIGKALESLVANAGVIHEDAKPRPTDPMFELWLRNRGLTPAAGSHADDEEVR
ncbi:MAG: hypothetical protein ACR2MK_10220 [Solirubrobacteraceae bacterium]